MMLVLAYVQSIVELRLLRHLDVGVKFQEFGFTAELF